MENFTKMKIEIFNENDSFPSLDQQKPAVNSNTFDGSNKDYFD